MKISGALDKLVELLNADPFFITPANPEADPPTAAVINVPVVTKKIGDVDAAVNEQLLSLGVGLLVLFRPAKFQLGESLSLELVVQFGLMAVENPTTKPDGAPTAEDICEAAMEILHGKRNGVSPNDESIAGRFMVDSNAMLPVPAPAKKAFLNFQLVNINTTIALTPR